MKKVLLMLLIGILALNVKEVDLVSASGADLNNNEMSDDVTVVESVEVSYAEEFEIEGIIYSYTENEISEGVIKSVVKGNDGTEEELIYNEREGVVYEGEDVIATIELVSISTNNMNRIKNTKASGGWKFLGQSNEKITFKQGVTVAVVAAAIAVVLPSFGPAGVIAAIGASALSAIAASSIGGTVTTRVWSKTVLGIYKTKNQWAFKTSTKERYPSSGYYEYITT